MEDREVFVERMKREWQSFGRHRQKCNGKILLYFDAGAEFNWLDKTYRYIDFYKLRGRLKHLLSLENKNGFIYVHVSPNVDE
jgi:hypothetical protein